MGERINSNSDMPIDENLATTPPLGQSASSAEPQTGEWRDEDGRTFEEAIWNDYYNAPAGSPARHAASRMIWGD